MQPTELFGHEYNMMLDSRSRQTILAPGNVPKKAMVDGYVSIMRALGTFMEHYVTMVDSTFGTGTFNTQTFFMKTKYSTVSVFWGFMIYRHCLMGDIKK